MQFRSWREYIMWGRVLGSSRQWHVLCRAVNGTLQSFTIQNSLLKIPTSACTHDAKTKWALDFRTWRVDVTFGHLSTKLRIFAYQTACWLFWTNVPISHLQMFKSPFSMGAFNKETAPEKGFSEHCDCDCEVSLTALLLCMRHHQGTLAAAPPSVGKQITVPHYSDISPAMFQCSHPASCSLTPGPLGNDRAAWKYGPKWTCVTRACRYYMCWTYTDMIGI